MIGWFNKEFVKSGKVSQESGQFVHFAYDKRTLGDYDDFVQFSEDEVANMLQQAREFIKVINGLICQ
jgi:uncharacterized protein (UPF0332 family)